jgi:hypothetical protein
MQTVVMHVDSCQCTFSNFKCCLHLLIRRPWKEQVPSHPSHPIPSHHNNENAGWCNHNCEGENGAQAHDVMALLLIVLVYESPLLARGKADRPLDPGPSFLQHVQPSTEVWMKAKKAVQVLKLNAETGSQRDFCVGGPITCDHNYSH